MNNSKTKIFIADDNNTFRKAVMDFLENSDNYNVVGTASDGQECLDKVENEIVDIILMDISMPIMNGIQTSKIINQKYNSYIKIIALTQHNDFEYIQRMIEAGAKGYVLKSEVGTQLIEAIETVMQGNIYYPELTK